MKRGFLFDQPLVRGGKGGCWKEIAKFGAEAPTNGSAIRELDRLELPTVNPATAGELEHLDEPAARGKQGKDSTSCIAGRIFSRTITADTQDVVSSLGPLGEEHSIHARWSN